MHIKLAPAFQIKSQYPILGKSLQKLYVLQKVPAVLSEKARKIAKKVPLVLFVKHTILVDLVGA